MSSTFSQDSPNYYRTYQSPSSPQRPARIEGRELLLGWLVVLSVGRVGWREKENTIDVDLTEQQQQALDALAADPLRVVDPRTQQVYVLLRADLYERLKDLLEEEEDRALRQ